MHNHFENNEFLGNKKALYYNMKAYYERNHLQVFDYLPVTFHVKRYGDEAWLEFSRYFQEDQRAKKEGEQRLWIVKPGENSNRGNGITIYSDFDKINAWVQSEISGENNPKKTFIIQKYIDRPLLYNKRKFDIRCYMLLVRLVTPPSFRTARLGATGTIRATSAPAAINSSWERRTTSSFTSPMTPFRSIVKSTGSMRMAIS